MDSYYLRGKEKSMYDAQTPMENNIAGVNPREEIQRHLASVRRSLTERLIQLDHLEERLGMFNLTDPNDRSLIMGLIRQIISR